MSLLVLAMEGRDMTNTRVRLADWPAYTGTLADGFDEWCTVVEVHWDSDGPGAGRTTRVCTDQLVRLPEPVKYLERSA